MYGVARRWPEAQTLESREGIETLRDRLPGPRSARREQLSLALGGRAVPREKALDLGRCIAHVVERSTRRSSPDGDTSSPALKRSHLADEEFALAARQVDELLAIRRRLTREQAIELGLQRRAKAFIDLADATPARDTPTGLMKRGAKCDAVATRPGHAFALARAKG